MAIEHHDWGTVITPPDIDRFRLLVLKHRMRLEMAGIRFAVSTFAQVRREFKLHGNRERVYRQFIEMHKLGEEAK